MDDPTVTNPELSGKTSTQSVGATSTTSADENSPLSGSKEETLESRRSNEHATPVGQSANADVAERDCRPTHVNNDQQAETADTRESPNAGGQQHDTNEHDYEHQFLKILHHISTSTTEEPRIISVFGGRNPRRSDVVARLINLSRKLSESSDPGSSRYLYRQAYFAANMYKSSPSWNNTVSSILDDIDFSTSKNSPIYVVMRGLSFSIVTMMAMGLFLFSVIFSFLIDDRLAPVDTVAVATDVVLDVAMTPLVISAVFGMLGSIVSILLRLSEFERATRRSRQFLLMTGFMLPFVGAIFASVTCALFASGIINFNFANGGNVLGVGINNPYFYVVIGFLSGFSERFTRGLLGRAESSLTEVTSYSETRKEESMPGRVMTVSETTDVLKSKP